MSRTQRSLLPWLVALAASCVAESAEQAPSAAAATASASVTAPAPKQATDASPTIEVGDAPFQGAKGSLDELGRAIVDALDTQDRAALVSLTVTPNEYKHRLFGAIAKHPNAYKMGPDLLWDMHNGESLGDMQSALQAWGGKNLAFESIVAQRREERAGLVFHKKPVITVKDADGNTHRLAILGTVIEHPASGGFKVLSFSDDG